MDDLHRVALEQAENMAEGVKAVLADREGAQLTADTAEACRTGARVLAGVSCRLNGAIRILEATQDQADPDVLLLVQNALGDAMEVVDAKAERLAKAAEQPSLPLRSVPRAGRPEVA